MLFLNSDISGRVWLQVKPSILTSSLVLFGLCGAAEAAPDIEQAPRLSNEDFGSELFPNEGAIAIPIGEAGFYPSGAVRISSVDNLYYQADNEVAVTRLQVTPKLDLIAEGSKSVFWGLLRGDLRKNSGDAGVERADASDFRLRGFAHFDIDNRHRLDFEASQFRISEELGTGRTRSNFDFDNPDTYELSRIGITYSYGNPRSRGELVTGLATGVLEFVENENDLAEFDRDMDLIWGRFSYKLTGKTTLSSRFDFRSYEYTNDINSEADRRDRDASSLTLSANWKSTGLLYGSAFVSFSNWEYTEREAAEGVDVDGKDTTFGANLYWEIRSYSKANFYIRQFIDDTVADDSSGTQTTATYGISWRHGWTDRFNTTVSAYSSNDELDNRKTNERQGASLEGRLSIRRWLNLLVGGSTAQLDSDEIDAKQNKLYVGLEGNL